MRLPTNLAAGLSLGWTGAFHRRRVFGRLREDHKVCKMNDHIGTTVFQIIFTACDAVGAIVVEWHAKVLLSCSSPLPHEHYASELTSSSFFSALNTILLSVCHDCCTLVFLWPAGSSSSSHSMRSAWAFDDRSRNHMMSTVNDTRRLWPVPGSHRPPRHQVFIPDAFASQVEAKSKHLVACAQTLFRLSGAQLAHISNLHWQGDIVFKPSSRNDSQSKSRCPFCNQGFVRVVCVNWLNCVNRWFWAGLSLQQVCATLPWARSWKSGAQDGLFIF